MSKDQTEWHSLAQSLLKLGAAKGPDYRLLMVDQGSIKGMSLSAVDQLVSARSKPYEMETDWVARGLTLEKGFRRGSPHAKRWLIQRLGAAHAFVRFMPDTAESLFAKSGMSEEAAVRWLVLDWWHEIGNYWYAMWLRNADAEPEIETKT